MVLGLELFADVFNVVGVLGVDLAVVPERPPVRRDAFAALLGQFVCGVRCDPLKDAGGDRAGEVGLVFFG